MRNLFQYLSGEIKNEAWKQAYSLIPNAEQLRAAMAKAHYMSQMSAIGQMQQQNPYLMLGNLPPNQPGGVMMLGNGSVGGSSSSSSSSSGMGFGAMGMMALLFYFSILTYYKGEQNASRIKVQLSKTETPMIAN